RSEPCPPGWVPGNLVVTDGLENKHTHPVIYEPDREAEPLPVSEELKKLYERDRDDIQRDPEHPGRALKPVEWDGKGPLSELPCFYLLDEAGKLVFFGATLFFRLPYLRSPSDFIKFQDPPEAPDLASRMFGTLDGPEGAIKGRVRFEDLIWDPAEGPEDPFVGIRYPKPLLAPKPACIQHYLVQESDDKKMLRHYDDLPPHEAGQPAETVLRGFKHYWHRKDSDRPERVVESHLDSSDPDKKRTVIRPVKEGVVFRGRIHFDNLSREELGALLVALDLEPNLRHKLGMARPFGYGSIMIEREETRIVDPAERYRSLFAADQSGGGPPALNAGWRKDSEEIAQRAKRSFCLALAKRRRETLADDADPEEVFRVFWSSDRMRDLAALLEWDRRPGWRRTAPADLDNDQWKKRKVLPPPTILVQLEPPPTDPSRGATPPSPVPIVGQALSKALRKPDESAGRQRAAPATKPVKAGQTRIGKLMKEGGSWVAILDGVPKSAVILNEGELPPAFPEGAEGRFEVKRATDYAGVQVIWKEFVE
ncbi:MAG: TIGR03986 family type III CRISPR-associated RAMP protein, partial [Actinomycetota bacterium]